MTPLRRACVLAIFSAFSLLAAPDPARANFHLWKVKEVFSNASGSIQFIELVSNEPDFCQNAISGHTLSATSVSGTDPDTNTFTIPTNLLCRTNELHLLFATPEFAALNIVTPDFILPCGAFFDPDADSIEIDFAGGFDVVTFAGSALPKDGINGLTDSTPFGAMNLMSAAASPTNFAGDTDSIALSACQTDGMCSPCDSDEIFCNGGGSCEGSACVDNGAPCTGRACDEDANACVDCSDPADCIDANPCTNTDCVGGACVVANNTASCDDGRHCTLTDACSGGVCVGSGDRCPGENCNEGSDSCGACAGASDCTDGDFCNGDEACTAGACADGSPACDPSISTCDEIGDVCDVFCGDGLLDTPEGCDDADRDSGDGCSMNCQMESGFICNTSVAPSVCMPSPVGDDAGRRVDAGSPDAGTAMVAGGCGCRTSTGSRAPWGLFFALAILVLRRRQSKR